MILIHCFEKCEQNIIGMLFGVPWAKRWNGNGWLLSLALHILQYDWKCSRQIIQNGPFKKKRWYAKKKEKKRHFHTIFKPPKKANFQNNEQANFEDNVQYCQKGVILLVGSTRQGTLRKGTLTIIVTFIEQVQDCQVFSQASNSLTLSLIWILK